MRALTRATVVAAALAPGLALPCSLVPTCTPVTLWPAASAPSNLGAVVIEAGVDCDGNPWRADDAVLETAGGEPVAFRREEERLVPTEPLGAGATYRARYTEACPEDRICPWDERGRPLPVDPREVVHAFHLGEAVPLPGSFGHLRLEEHGAATRDVWTTRGQCTVDVDVEQYVLSWVPGPRFDAWADLTELSVRVNGEAWPGLTLWSACEAQPEAWDGTPLLPGRDYDAGLPPGTNVVEVTARVLGTNVELGETLSLELCTGVGSQGRRAGCQSADGPSVVALVFVLLALARAR